MSFSTTTTAAAATTTRVTHLVILLLVAVSTTFQSAEAFSVTHPTSPGKIRVTSSTALNYTDEPSRKSARDLVIEKHYGSRSSAAVTTERTNENENDVSGQTSDTETLAKKTTKNTILQIKSFEDFERIVLKQKETMVVVRFMASWCPGCKATTPAYKRLTAKLRSKDVLFVDCPLDGATQPFHEQLGVTAIPFVQVYDPAAGLVEEKQMTRSNFFAVEETLRSLIQ